MSERPRNVVRELIGRYGYASPEGDMRVRKMRVGEVPSSDDLRAFGPLVELVVRTNLGDREVWRFDPWPRLVYHRTSKRLWIVGAGFSVDGRGFHSRKGRVGLARVPIDEARKRHEAQYREYVRTHYGVKPTASWRGVIVAPTSVVAVGELESAMYRADRNDGDGQSNWKHPIEDEGEPRRATFHKPPTVCLNTTGRRIYIVGGTYSVKNGWMVG